MQEVSALNKQQKELKRFISPRGTIPRSSRLTEPNSIYELIKDQERLFSTTNKERFESINSHEDQTQEQNKLVDE
jgi:hypothetical protein